ADGPRVAGRFAGAAEGDDGGVGAHVFPRGQIGREKWKRGRGGEGESGRQGSGIFSPSLPPALSPPLPLSPSRSSNTSAHEAIRRQQFVGASRQSRPSEGGGAFAVGFGGGAGEVEGDALVLLVEPAPARALARDVLEDLVGLDQAGPLHRRRDDGGGAGGVPVPDQVRDAGRARGERG